MQDVCFWQKRRKHQKNSRRKVVANCFFLKRNVFGVSLANFSMSFNSQHLRFSVDLSSKAGHEAIISHIEGELKHLEHVKEYLTKRAKVELEYASALARINTAAAKVINENDRESPIRKVRCIVLNVVGVYGRHK